MLGKLSQEEAKKIEKIVIGSIRTCSGLPESTAIISLMHDIEPSILFAYATTVVLALLEENKIMLKRKDPS